MLELRKANALQESKAQKHVLRVTLRVDVDELTAEFSPGITSAWLRLLCYSSQRQRSQRATPVKGPERDCSPQMSWRNWCEPDYSWTRTSAHTAAERGAGKSGPLLPLCSLPAATRALGHRLCCCSPRLLTRTWVFRRSNRAAQNTATSASLCCVAIHRKSTPQADFLLGMKFLNSSISSSAALGSWDSDITLLE